MVNFSRRMQMVALEPSDSSPFHFWESIDEQPLRTLAASLERRRLLQPIFVRRKGERFEVV